MSSDDIVKDYISDSITSFRAYKKMADKAIAQVNDDELFVTIDDESNSIAIVMKHMAGNMLSRWTDFLTTDGEKPTRNRDMEFVIESRDKDELIDYWERGWNALFTAVEPLQLDDFEKTVSIRGEEHTIVKAINRQLTHYAYHIGQIVFLAKHFRSSEWRSLSIPKNKSAAFNQYLQQGKAVGQDRMEAAMTFAKETDNKS
ncbi:MAG TPA: DUF1572 family protein [Pyrinomonadaceae bacterium]|nr:DUF1572 family protein [Pyrinomonadaceae bacterium]